MATEHKSRRTANECRRMEGIVRPDDTKVANASRPYGLLECAMVLCFDADRRDLQQRDERLDEAEGKATPQMIASCIEEHAKTYVMRVGSACVVHGALAVAVIEMHHANVCTSSCQINKLYSTLVVFISRFFFVRFHSRFNRFFSVRSFNLK